MLTSFSSARTGELDGLTLRDLISERTLSEGAASSTGVYDEVRGPLWTISFD